MEKVLNKITDFVEALVSPEKEEEKKRKEAEEREFEEIKKEVDYYIPISTTMYKVHVKDFLTGKPVSGLCKQDGLGELMDRTFSSLEIPFTDYYNYQFLHKGTIITPDSTCEELGFSRNKINVIDFVPIKPVHQEIDKMFRKMNRYAVAMNVTRHGQPTPLSSDSLNYIFSLLSWGDIFTCSFVNVFWHHVAHRFSMMNQIECGITGWLKDQPYPFWMQNIMSELSWRVTLAESEQKRARLDYWSKLSIPKSGIWRHYPLSKTIGAQLRPTEEHLKKRQQLIEATGLSSLSDLKFKFFEQCKQYYSNAVSESILETIDWDTLASMDLKGLEIGEKETDSTETQQEPPPNSFGFICEAILPRHKNTAIGYFKDSFSPDVQYIFPLITYRKALFELDFRSCRTWVIFPQVGAEEEKPIPAGAVSWRVHKAAAFGSVVGVLEVLFLVISQEHRKKKFGEMLVAKLKEEALKENCKMMYVEIGKETVHAEKFWTHNSFKTCKDLECSEKQMHFFEFNCMRFNDTVQFAYILD
eukprot:TRINITY_DN5316_c1_g1_i3.p1 TRINITY_DN5316_c1_g1~~TRINITY_DN5316_c1_g1_i3.p1  ORF type:complete len:528 (-),score=165.95 TRINITY_DN5316_c1_g1_i3:36-1619(-)